MWFEDPINLEKWVFNDTLWWHHNAIVVPKVDILCEDILMDCHDVFLIGTHGYHKDIEASRTRFQWPSLRDDVKNM